jgi:hypothetical protein
VVGINNSYAPESPVADSVYAGVPAVMRSLHARKPQARILLNPSEDCCRLWRDQLVSALASARARGRR